MNTFEEKRKNDDRRGFPWRSVVLLLIGFALGVFVTLLVVPSRIETVTYMSSDGMELTATRIIQQATEMAGGVFVAPDNDGQGTPMTDEIWMTATAIIQQATQTAGS